MSPRRVPTRGSWVESADVDGETVVFDERTVTVHRFNSTAAAVWSLCDGRRDVDGIVTRLRERYAGDAGQIAADVVELLGRFDGLGLLEPPGVASDASRPAGD